MKTPRDVPHRVIQKASEMSVQEFGFAFFPPQYFPNKIRNDNKDIQIQSKHNRFIIQGEA